MDIEKVIINDGEYQADIDVTVDEWKEILKDESFEVYLDTLIKFYSEPNHKSTCKSLGDKYNVSPQSFSVTIVSFAKAVQKKLNRFEIIGVDGKPTYWVIPMLGKRVGEHFEWKIRPELVQALNELDIKVKHKLQFIYDEAINKKHWVFFIWFPIYKTYVKQYKEQAISNSWDDAIFQRLVKKTTENGISDLQQGNFTWEEYNKIKEKWDEIQPIIKKIAESNQIDNVEFNEITLFFGKQTNTNRPAATNRVISAFLPNVITTVVSAKYFTATILELNKRFNDYPNIEGNWLNDNINFINYCNSKIIFNDPWHSSLFAWYLKEYFEEEAKTKKENFIIMKQYTDLLIANKNLILTGAPGTGKTYLAKEIAKALDAETEFVQFHPSYDYTDFVEGLRPEKKDNSELGFKLRDGVFKRFCKKAIKNIVDSQKSAEELSKEAGLENQLTEFLDSAIENVTEYELKKGNTFLIIAYDDDNIEISVPKNQITSTLTIKTALLRSLLLDNTTINSVKGIRDYFGRKHHAQSDSYLFILYKQLKENIVKKEVVSERVNPKNYVIIIDEINRAEISKVFGELFFSIDPGYRGVNGRVKTQYSNLQEIDDVFADGFYVPENVYIIGTMNDIDRSVESMDFAMRRRFGWKEITANSRIAMWDGLIADWKEKALKSMQSLNSKIESIPGLGSAFHIGPAYFLKLKNYNGDFESLWDFHLKGVLFEYLRGLPEGEKRLSQLKIAFDNTNELMDDVENNR